MITCCKFEIWKANLVYNKRFGISWAKMLVNVDNFVGQQSQFERCSQYVYKLGTKFLFSFCEQSQSLTPNAKPLVNVWVSLRLAIGYESFSDYLMRDLVGFLRNCFWITQSALGRWLNRNQYIVSKTKCDLSARAAMQEPDCRVLKAKLRDKKQIQTVIWSVASRDRKKELVFEQQAAILGAYDSGLQQARPRRGAADWALKLLECGSSSQLDRKNAKPGVSKCIRGYVEVDWVDTAVAPENHFARIASLRRNHAEPVGRHAGAVAQDYASVSSQDAQEERHPRRSLSVGARSDLRNGVLVQLRIQLM